MRAPTEARPKRLPALVELSRDRLVPDDRAGDELRKEGNVKRDVDRIAIGAEAPPVDVDDVGQAVEGEERDAERQLDVRMAEVIAERLQERGEIGGDEVGVFENAEHQEIARHGNTKRPFSARVDVAVDDDRRDVVEGNGEEENQEEARLAPRVEDEREQKRDDVLADDGWGEDIAGDENRQEIEKKRDRGKHHAGSLSLACSDETRPLSRPRARVRGGRAICGAAPQSAPHSPGRRAPFEPPYGHLPPTNATPIAFPCAGRKKSICMAKMGTASKSAP